VVAARLRRWGVLAIVILTATALVAALVWPRRLLNSIYAVEDYAWLLDGLTRICLVGLAIIATLRLRERRRSRG
jgi:hypothetical protein